MEAGQRKTLHRAVVYKRSDMCHVTLLMQGPPGAGKTTTVSTMLCVLAASKLSRLVTAPTNVAVQTVASCFMETVQTQDGSAGDGGLVAAVGKLQVGDMVSGSKGG